MALDLQSVSLGSIVIVLLVWATYSWLQETSPKAHYPLPPGPPGEPIIGHLRIVPIESPEYAFQRWSKEYGERRHKILLSKNVDTYHRYVSESGDVIHFNMIGQHVVVLNSVQASVELLEKRGAKYSDRPFFALFEV